MQTINGIPVFGEPVDAGALEQITRCVNTGALGGALMGDHHKGYALPIGGVVAYSEQVSPSGVGYDIACGNKAIRLDVHVNDFDVEVELPKIMDEIFNTISFGVGRANNEDVDHKLFDDDAWRLPALAPLKELAHNQLGTVGSGNHFVDVFSDEFGFIWIGVHFGSRGLGHKTATWFLNAGGAKDGMDVEPLVLSTRSNLGIDYLEAMRLCGEYAYAGRDWVCNRVAEIFGCYPANGIEAEVHNHHNFAWEENHFGLDTIVVRKGATPLFPGQLAFVGGSMGDDSFILKGKDSDEARQAFHSTVHGAGRVMSRTEAKGKYNRKTGELVKAGKISPEMMSEWLAEKGVVLRGAGLDEAPQAYKRIDDVLSHHEGTLDIIHRLTPLGVCMAGANEFDPYKD